METAAFPAALPQITTLPATFGAAAQTRPNPPAGFMFFAAEEGGYARSMTAAVHPPRPLVHAYDPVHHSTFCNIRIHGEEVFAIESAVDPNILKVTCPDCCARLVAELRRDG